MFCGNFTSYGHNVGTCDNTEIHCEKKNKKKKWWLLLLRNATEDDDKVKIGIEQQDFQTVDFSLKVKLTSSLAVCIITMIMLLRRQCMDIWIETFI